MTDKYNRFAELGFNDFKKMAQDSSLSQYEKIGFPDSYRENKEENIFNDILHKIPALSQKNKVILDVGPGCSGLAKMIINQCRRQGHTLILIDSDEMLSHIPDEEFIIKIGAFYPKCQDLFDHYHGQIDGLIVYSVFHYLFVEANVWEFLDRSMQLLNNGGSFLIGDIPNISKRKRFFSSSTGIEFHRKFTGKIDDKPDVIFNQVEAAGVDDSVMFALLTRARLAGYDAYLLPQDDELPMANRREDILIVRP